MPESAGEGGVSLGGSPWQGGLLGKGGGIPACTEAEPPINRITDTSKNITLVTTSLRPVNIYRRSVNKPLKIKLLGA